MSKRALFDTEGLHPQFYDDDFHAEVPNGAIEISEEQWIDLLTHPGTRRWDGRSVVEYVPPLSVITATLAVTRLQGRLALSRAGLLAKAEAAVSAAGGETAIWYDDAQTWRRDDPHVAAIGQALSLASADIDKLFAEAASI